MSQVAAMGQGEKEAENIPRKRGKLRKAYRTCPVIRVYYPTPGTNSLQVFCIRCYNKHYDEKQECRR